MNFFITSSSINPSICPSINALTHHCINQLIHLAVHSSIHLSVNPSNDNHSFDHQSLIRSSNHYFTYPFSIDSTVHHPPIHPMMYPPVNPSIHLWSRALLQSTHIYSYQLSFRKSTAYYQGYGHNKLVRVHTCTNCPSRSVCFPSILPV